MKKMLKRVLPLTLVIVLAFALLPAAAMAGIFSISGYVFDQTTGARIAGARVIAICRNNDGRVTYEYADTNDNGNYKMVVESDLRVTLVVVKYGYMDESEEVMPVPDHAIRNISLLPFYDPYGTADADSVYGAFKLPAGTVYYDMVEGAPGASHTLAEATEADVIEHLANGYTKIMIGTTTYLIKTSDFSGGGTTSKAPKTGYDTDIMGWLIALIVCGATAAVIITRKKLAVSK